MTIEEIKNEVAQERKYANWDTLIFDLRRHNIDIDIVIELENEAMQRYAELKCKEQREICAESAYLSATETWFLGGKPKEISKDVGKEYQCVSLNKDSILNAKLATSKTT